jgi:hypothetical protein
MIFYRHLILFCGILQPFTRYWFQGYLFHVYSDAFNKLSGHFTLYIPYTFLLLDISSSIPFFFLSLLISLYFPFLTYTFLSSTDFVFYHLKYASFFSLSYFSIALFHRTFFFPFFPTSTISRASHADRILLLNMFM